MVQRWIITKLYFETRSTTNKIVIREDAVVILLIQTKKTKDYISCNWEITG